MLYKIIISQIIEYSLQLFCLKPNNDKPVIKYDIEQGITDDDDCDVGLDIDLLVKSDADLLV